MFERITRHTVNHFKRALFRLGLKKSFKPPAGTVSLGDLERTKPLSKKFGYDRGGPVDRYYIERFLEQEAEWIRGSVMEIQENEYTMKYGRNKVTRSEILDVNRNNTNATIIADLSNAPELPDNSFDCLIITQTLQLIYDFKNALRTCRRLLKPKGTLLLTVPGITPIDSKRLGHTWYWSFTHASMKRIMEETFRDDSVEIHSFGNVLSATAFLYGMGRSELTTQQLDVNDPNLQVIITVKAVRKD